MTATTTHTDRRARTRAKVMAAAVELFARRGFHNTHVVDIVADANVSAGTFYKYFEDKRAIYWAVMEDISTDLRAQVANLRAQALAVPPHNQIAYLTDSFRVFFESIAKDHSQYLILLRGGFGVDESIDNAVWEVIERFAGDIAEDLSTATSLGLLEPIDHTNTGRLIAGMCIQIAHAMLATGSPTPAQAAQLTMRFCMGGVIGMASETTWSNWSMAEFQAMLRQPILTASPTKTDSGS